MNAMSMERAAAWWSRMSGAPRPHRATLVRWAMHGVRGFRLRAERSGGRWYVTEEALLEFHRRINELPDVASPAGPARAAAIAGRHRRLDELIGTDELVAR